MEHNIRSDGLLPSSWYSTRPNSRRGGRPGRDPRRRAWLAERPRSSPPPVRRERRRLPWSRGNGGSRSSWRGTPTASTARRPSSPAGSSVRGGPGALGGRPRARAPRHGRRRAARSPEAPTQVRTTRAGRGAGVAGGVGVGRRPDGGEGASPFSSSVRPSLPMPSISTPSAVVGGLPFSPEERGGRHPPPPHGLMRATSATSPVRSKPSPSDWFRMSPPDSLAPPPPKGRSQRLGFLYGQAARCVCSRHGVHRNGAQNSLVPGPPRPFRGGCGEGPRKGRGVRERRGPVDEPGLTQAFREAQGRGKVTVSTDAKGALPEADVVLICVGTPSTYSGEVDLSQMLGLVDDIAQGADSGPQHRPLVVGSAPPALPERLGVWAP